MGSDKGGGSVEDDEVFEWFDAFVDWLKELPVHETNMLNFRRVREMNNAYRFIVESLNAAGCDAKVSCGYGEFGDNIGYIEVEGDSIDFANLDYFSCAASLANNTEVYPLVNGKVRMALTFYKVIIPI